MGNIDTKNLYYTIDINYIASIKLSVHGPLMNSGIVVLYFPYRLLCWNFKNIPSCSQLPGFKKSRISTGLYPKL